MEKDPVLRLSRYNRLLKKMKSLGFHHVFSDNIADAIGISSSLVRKDFAYLQLSGIKRGGYEIEKILSKLNSILKKDINQNIVLIGCGKIGQALLEYKEFKTDGIQISAGFDTDVNKINPNIPIPIYSIDKLEKYIKENKIQIAIIATPDSAATQIMNNLINAGIKGILNFAPVDLKTTGKCHISNVNLGIEIENLFYMVNSKHITEEINSIKK